MLTRRLAGGTALALALMIGTAGIAGAQPSTEEPARPTSFEGRILCGPDATPGTTELTRFDGSGDPWTRTEATGAWRTPIASMSDERLAGTALWSHERVDYLVPASGDPSLTVGTGTWRIENDGGTWEGSVTTLRTQDAWATSIARLVGDGGYEGLVAAMESDYQDGQCAWEVRGIIYEE